MQYVVRIAIVAMFSVATLSGCLVTKKDIEQIFRSTDNLRVYQDGDYINYYVTVTTIGVGGITRNTGTLRIAWSTHPALERPPTGDGTPINDVLKEVTTLSLDEESDKATIRYISQDTDGQITLHAVGDGTERYWLSETGVVDLTVTESSVIFYSPIVAGIKPQTDFFVMDECEGNANCNSEVGRYIDNQEPVGSSTSILTNMGNFVNPWQINFYGSSAPSPAPLPVIFDIRNVCGTDDTQHGYAGNGRMYVMPEIGPVKIDNTCFRPIENETVIYTITIRSTNIPLP